MNRSGNRWWLSILAGAILGVLGLVTILLVTRLNATASSSQEIALTILPRPTDTPTPTATALPVPSATSTEPPPSGSGDPQAFVSGQLVEVSGTEGEGLRMREGPSLQATIRFVALESEVFEVLEGPVQADGYNWWRLSNPYDPGKQGWAVGIFLRGINS